MKRSLRLLWWSSLIYFNIKNWNKIILQSSVRTSWKIYFWMKLISIHRIHFIFLFQMMMILKKICDSIFSRVIDWHMHIRNICSKLKVFQLRWFNQYHSILTIINIINSHILIRKETLKRFTYQIYQSTQEKQIIIQSKHDVNIKRVKSCAKAAILRKIEWRKKKEMNI